MTDPSRLFRPTRRGGQDRSMERRTVTRGVAWTVPVISVATAAPAFAASPNVTVTQTDCNRTTIPYGPGSPYCIGGTTYGRLTWTIDTTAPIPVGTNFTVTFDRTLYCRVNRVTGNLRDGGYIGTNSTSETSLSATYAVIKQIPAGTGYIFAEGFAVQSGDATMFTLCIPTISGEWDGSDNCAGRTLRVSGGLTSCTL